MAHQGKHEESEGLDTKLADLSLDEKLFRIVYTSVLIDVGSLQDIIAQAQMNNPRQQIGGQLTVELENNKVRQILEGKYRDLIVLFEKIRRDPRHKEVCLESRQYIEQRSFRKWGVMTLVVTAALDGPAQGKKDLKNDRKSKKEQKILQVEYTSRLKNKEDIGEIMAIARIKNQVLGVGGKLSLYLQDSL
mmetsp:Transcript_2578/g.4927  ORF Transcript_2578/g.4927 Transcript_2578/m.4927 type:complete len:190 (-) Transcript_2578:463-1032(-)